jgi:RNA polymerase sigma-70 factor (ECF subfamily)
MLEESDLIENCKRGNRAAQQELYNRYVNKMAAVCYRYTGNKEDAVDIVQDGFITVFADIHKFKATGALEGWIKRIMINKSINFFKKNRKYNYSWKEVVDVEDKREEEAEISDHSSEFDIVKYADITKDELRLALETLDLQFRLVFSLFYLENYTHKEIAEALAIDEQTSRTRLLRAKKKLQGSLYQLSLDKLKLSKQNN